MSAILPTLFRATSCLALLAACPDSGALAQDASANPRAWRPMVVTDLRLPGPSNQSYAQLWSDLIAKNNDLAGKASGQRRLVGNAPVKEAHVVVRNATTVATLSILNTPAQCQPHEKHGAIRICPLRLAVHRNGASTLREATGCFVEADTSAGTGLFASYDVEAKTIRLGALLAHQAIDGCSRTVPVSETR